MADSSRKSKAGRPSKLTPELQEKLCKLMAMGNYHCVAARACGIDETTFNNWMKWGEEQKKGKFFRFFEAIKKAEAESEARHIQNVDHHAFGRPAQYDENGNLIRAEVSSSWIPSMTFLERKHPDRWGRKDRMEHVTPKDEEIRIRFIPKDEKNENG